MTSAFARAFALPFLASQPATSTSLCRLAAPILTLLLLLTPWLSDRAAAADPPGILNHQGRIAVEGTNFDGAGQFKFALVNAAGDTSYWSNDDSSTTGDEPTAAVPVTVTKGHYAVLLGDSPMGAISASVFSDNADVRLRLWFSADGGTTFEQLTPDRRIAAVGYALNATQGPVGERGEMGYSGPQGIIGLTGPAGPSTVSGNTFYIGPDEDADEADSLLQFGTDATVRMTLLENGNLGIGTPIPNSRLHVDGDGTIPSLRVQVGGGSKLTVDGNGGTAIGAFVTPPANGLSVEGRAGIGTITPAAKLDVNGAIRLAGNAATETAGMIRWTGTDFEGFDGSAWVSLTPPAAGSIMDTQLASGLTLGGTTSGTFSGDGSGLTNIPAGAVVTPPPGMVLIPAGEFTMGDSLDELSNAVPISTTVSAFYMDVNQVTLSQWQSVQQWGTLVGGYTDLPAGSGKGATHPVHTVSWYAMVKWCNARSEREGKTPVYYTDDAQTTVYRTGNVNVTNLQVKWSANGYRLPTEAEWEKAARGGLAGKRFPWGDTISQKQANYRGNTGLYDQGPDGFNAIGSVGGTSPATSPVGSFAANGYGLNDMAGNVYEWCWDWYPSPFTAYTGGADPQGPATGSLRVVRGGDWYGFAGFARCAYRNGYGPGGAGDIIGFRAVLAPGQP